MTISPMARTTLFSQVALLPIRHENNQADQTVTDLFFLALEKEKKYQLVAPLELDQLLIKNSAVTSRTTLREQALAFGRAAGFRGIINGKISPETGKDGAPLLWHILLRMTDLQQSAPIWTLTISITPQQYEDSRQLAAVMERGIAALLNQQIQYGDIFSTCLQKPEITSANGNNGQTTVTVTPNSSSTYPLYQLMRANAPDQAFIFTGHQKSTLTSPVILIDTDVTPGKTYYYTVIGINNTGLANVPNLPFAVTISPPIPPEQSWSSPNAEQ